MEGQGSRTLHLSSIRAIAIVSREWLTEQRAARHTALKGGHHVTVGGADVRGDSWWASSVAPDPQTGDARDSRLN